MTDSLETRLLLLVMRLPILVPAIAVHEFGHAWMADRCGDDTPRRQGRVTLDPLAHFEFSGTLMIILTSLTGFGFGWGRPVMVDPRNFKVPRRDDILVTAAGPFMNAVQIVFYLLLLVTLRFVAGGERNSTLAADVMTVPSDLVSWLVWFGAFGVIINTAMIAFNLIPIPPLDGSRIVAQLSPLPVRQLFYQLEAIGPWLLLFLMIRPEVLDQWMGPAIMWAFRIIEGALY